MVLNIAIRENQQEKMQTITCKINLIVEAFKVTFPSAHYIINNLIQRRNSKKIFI